MRWAMSGNATCTTRRSEACARASSTMEEAAVLTGSQSMSYPERKKCIISNALPDFLHVALILTGPFSGKQPTSIAVRTRSGHASLSFHMPYLVSPHSCPTRAIVTLAFGPSDSHILSATHLDCPYPVMPASLTSEEGSSAYGPGPASMLARDEQYMKRDGCLAPTNVKRVSWRAASARRNTRCKGILWAVRRVLPSKQPHSGLDSRAMQSFSKLPS